MNENNNANFTPDAPNFKTLVKMSFQGLTNFPYIEEDFDSLTNYGFLSKVVEYLNEVISNNNEQNSLITGLYNAYVSLQDYVNNYFDNLDVQDEINNKLEEMADSGELTTLIRNYLDPIIAEQNMKINNIEDLVDSAVSGSPLVATTMADMTDTSRIYVLITDGYWYYYNSTNNEWTQGGIYQAAVDLNQVNTLSNDLYKLNIEKPINNVVTSSSEDTKTIIADIKTTDIGVINYTIQNTANTDGYATIKGVKSGNVVQTYFSGLVEAHTTSSGNITLTSDIDSIEIKNTNKKNYFIFNLGIGYKQALIDTIEDQQVIKEQMKYITKEENPQYKGYVNSNGTLVKQGSSATTTNRYTIFENIIPNSSFMYSGAYAGWAVVWGYYADGTPVQLLSRGTYSGKIIQVNDPNIVKIIAWSDINVKPLSFHYYNEPVQFPNTIIVDVNGGGDFNNIQDAIDYAKNNFDVINSAVTIFVKNGEYNVSPKATSPYFAINKGANKISIIGESKEHTIINCTCTDELQGIVLNIGGDCIIENLTINNFADTSFTTETILEGNHRPYCIHNDAIIPGNTTPYKTTVKNCRLYSECYTPLGAGLHHLQTQQYIDTDFIYNSNVYNTEAAIYVHASYDNSATPSGLEVINCSAISLNGAPCIFTTNISGSVNMGQIPQTYQRNILYTTGENELNMVGLGGITNWSKLNTNSSLNK